MSFEAVKFPSISFRSASIGISLCILSSELSINWSVIVLDRTENDVAQLLIHDPFTTYAASSSVINVNTPNHGLTSGDTYRFRGTPTIAGDYANPASFDGIAGSNIAKAAGYAIVTGKYVSGSRDTDFTDDWFYFTVDTSTATTGGITGGGFPVSIGPATLSA